jgi:hypothetical protein
VLGRGRVIREQLDIGKEVLSRHNPELDAEFFEDRDASGEVFAGFRKMASHRIENSEHPERTRPNRPIQSRIGEEPFAATDGLLGVHRTENVVDADPPERVRFFALVTGAPGML